MVKSARLRSKLKLKTQNKSNEVKRKKRNIITSSPNLSAFATYLSESAEKKNEEKEKTADVTSLCETEQRIETMVKCEDHPLDNEELVVDESYVDALDSAETSCAEEKTEVNQETIFQLSDCEQKRETVCTNSAGTWTVIPLDSDRSSVLLLLHEECKGVNIFGYGYMESLKGVASVLGKSITPGMEKVKFHAPVTHYAFVVRPVVETNDLDWNFEDFEMNQQAKDLCRHCKFVLLLSSLDDNEENHGFPGYRELYKVRPSDGVIVGHLNKESWIVETAKFFKEYPEYGSAWGRIAEFMESTSRRAVILTVGGKGTGKSTFNRFLVNKFLEKSPKIYYLDCDIGQPEFTPSGFVSLSLVEECLLGPPFTHPLSPLFSVYYGNITPSGLPDFYMECIKRSLSALPDDPFPVVVNAMGWNRALGLHLLIDTIRMVNPTHIVQIVSPKESKNLPLLTPSYVREATGWITDSEWIQPTHEIISMNIEVFSTDIVVYKSSDLRDLRLLSNLTRLQISCLNNPRSMPRLSLRSLSCIRPYKAFCKDLVLCVAHESAIKASEALALFNASIVALCELPDETFQHYKNESKVSLPSAPICQSLGIGIVRGVDHVKNALYIISSLSEEKMQSINCVVMGALTIPESLFQESMKNKEFGQSPYTSQGLFQAKGSSKFRVYRSFIK